MTWADVASLGILAAVCTSIIISTREWKAPLAVFAVAFWLAAVR